MNQERFDVDYDGNLILADVQIAGNVKTDVDIRLDGCIEGNVFSPGQVIVNKGAVIDGDVSCGVLFVNGVITGNVCAKCKVVMGGSAVVNGWVETACLEITTGAEIKVGLRLKKCVE